MAKKLTEEELNQCSKDILITLFMALQDQMQELNLKIDKLTEQLAIAQNYRYGRRSEKLDVIDGQLCFDFNEPEALTENMGIIEEPAPEEVVEEVIKKKKRKGKRQEDLSVLPLETIHHELTQEELSAIFGENEWKQLPDETYLRVRVEPAKYTVEEHHVSVYAGRSKTDARIVRASHPESLLRNSIVTPSLAASIMNAKYVNGMPLHRISQEFQRNDIQISKQVMANWVIQCGERYFGPVYDCLHKYLLSQDVIQADETPCLVSKDGRPANSKSYMWVYRTSKYNEKTPFVLFDYQKTRNGDHARRFLEGFQGTCVCDSFSGYRKIDRQVEEITFAGCYAHARRKFADALKALPKDKKSAAKNTVAHQALERIAEIYQHDNLLAGLTPLERQIKRDTDVRPLVDAFFAWAKKVKAEDLLPADSATLDGINYCINHEKSLKVFLDNGNVPMDNNATESALRPFCLHKHTWKLIDTINGAKSSALIYSIVESAKINNLNPFRYMEYLLSEMVKHQKDTDYGFIKNLLPWSDKLLEICHSKKKQ